MYKVKTKKRLKRNLSAALVAAMFQMCIRDRINDAANILKGAMDALTPLGENLALGGTAVANSTYEGAFDQDSYEIELALDGDCLLYTSRHVISKL